MTTQQSVAACTVQADPKAIEARRNGGRINQTTSVKEVKTAQHGINWRKEHGLQSMKRER